MLSITKSNKSNKNKKTNTYKPYPKLNLKNTKNTKNSKNTKKNNFVFESLYVFYPQLKLNSSFIYTIPQLYSVYQNSPNITITNAKQKLYLITMTDPDAPSGIQMKSKNHTHTHWVYLQDMRKRNSTNTNTNKTILVPYAPPTPPFGIHRYQFTLYDLTNLSQTILDTLKNNSINNILDRNIYYRKYLQELKKYKINTLFQYKIDSGK